MYLTGEVGTGVQYRLQVQRGRSGIKAILEHQQVGSLE